MENSQTVFLILPKQGFLSRFDFGQTHHTAEGLSSYDNLNHHGKVEMVSMAHYTYLISYLHSAKMADDSGSCF